MGKLFIANCTKQFQDFTYTLPERPGVITQRIGPGGQLAIYGDLNPLQIESILAQHANYGLVPAVEVDRAKEFVGLCFSIDTPVKMPKIEKMLDHNDQMLRKRGEEIRDRSAIALNQAVEAATAPLKSLELEFIQEKGRDDAPIVESHVRVQREPGQPVPRARGRR